MRVESTCGVNEKKHSSHSQLSYNLKHCKVTYLNWKANTKGDTEKALYNLSSDNLYLLSVSFCRFHETFGLNKIVSMGDLLFLFIFDFL